jgi:hypothetical protein
MGRHYVLDVLRSLFHQPATPRPEPAQPTDRGYVSSVSPSPDSALGVHTSSPRPSWKPGSSQQGVCISIGTPTKLASPHDAIAAIQHCRGHLPSDRTLDDSISQLAHGLQPVAQPVIHENSDLTLTLGQHSSMPRPPSRASQTAGPDSSLHHDPRHPSESPHPQERREGIFYQASNISLSGAVLIDNNADNGEESPS